MTLATLQPKETRRLAPLSEKEQINTVVKAIVRSADAWALTNQEAAALFDVPTATWSRMKAGTYRGNLDQDKVTRASLMIGVFKGLRLLFNGPLTFSWPKMSNTGPEFKGASPIKLMIEGGIPAMIRVRQHVDALRGGM